MGLGEHHSLSDQSEESVLDLEKPYYGSLQASNSQTLQPFTAPNQHSTYFSWPASSHLHGSPQNRARHFSNLIKESAYETLGTFASDKQAISLFELMMIRAFHSKILRQYSLGTAVGFRIRNGVLTNIPAILVFVARKVHQQWLRGMQCLPSYLEGPGGVWCDVDVVEFSYYGASTPTPKEQLYSELVDGLRGSDPFIGSGSQVASQDTYGTLTAIVKSKIGNQKIGFLTNRHVALDLDYPSHKMFHPLPPNLGPGVYLGAVERVTSFIKDAVWYGIYAGTNPETYVRADGAFVLFADDFDISHVTTVVKGVGEIGEVKRVELQDPVNSIVGRHVLKVGRSSGLTTGMVMAYALEYNDDRGICLFTDFLVVGENQQTFDLEGDSGSLILLAGNNCDKPRPVGVIWGGTAYRGRLKLMNGRGPQNWTSGVDLGRLLGVLDLDLITTTEVIQEALQELRNVTAKVDSTDVESFLADGEVLKERIEEISKPLDLDLQIPRGTSSSGQSLASSHTKMDERSSNVEEYQFLLGVDEVAMRRQDVGQVQGSPFIHENSWHEECTGISLQLGERESKRQKSDIRA